MREYIAQKARFRKIFLVLFLSFVVLFGAAVACLFLIPEFKIAFYVFFFLFPCLWIFPIIFFSSICPFGLNLKWLKKSGKWNVIDDIDLETPMLPRSKIYCGQQAFFSKGSHCIIPYDQVLWVYVREHRYYGIPLSKTVMIYMKDRKGFAVDCDVQEFQWLLENRIAPQSPYVVVGYGPQQQKRYKELYRAFRAGKL